MIGIINLNDTYCITILFFSITVYGITITIKSKNPVEHVKHLLKHTLRILVFAV